MTEMTFNRACGPKDWSPLPRQFDAGDTVLRYPGYDYGCCADDRRLVGIETIACCLKPEGPFFTVPVDWLRSDDNAR